MKGVVDKKRLLKEIKTGKAIQSCSDGEYFDQDLVLGIIEDCTLSPAELGGDSWVLEKLKKKLCDDDWVLDQYTCDLILEELNNLESQAPVSELAKQAKEDRRKVKAWDKLRVLAVMNELLAQEESDGKENTGD